MSPIAERVAARPDQQLDHRRQLSGFVARHPLPSFFTLAFTFSWTYWIPIALTGCNLSHFPGLVGPMLAAIVVAAMTQRGGVLELLSRMLPAHIPLGWFALAVSPLALGLMALLGIWVTGAEEPSLAELGRMPGVAHLGWVATFAVVFLNLVGIPPLCRMILRDGRWTGAVVKDGRTMGKALARLHAMTPLRGSTPARGQGRKPRDDLRSS